MAPYHGKQWEGFVQFVEVIPTPFATIRDFYLNCLGLQLFKERGAEGYDSGGVADTSLSRVRRTTPGLCGDSQQLTAVTRLAYC